jgi:hypothetical protein
LTLALAWLALAEVTTVLDALTDKPITGRKSATSRSLDCTLPVSMGVACDVSRDKARARLSIDKHGQQGAISYKNKFASSAKWPMNLQSAAQNAL